MFRTGGIALKILTTVTLITLAGPFHHMVGHHHHGSGGHAAISTSFEGVELSLKALHAAEKLLSALPCKAQLAKRLAGFKKTLEDLHEDPSREGIKAGAAESAAFLGEALRSCAGDDAQPFTQQLEEADGALQEAHRLKEQEALLQNPLKEVGSALEESAQGAQQVFWSVAKSAGELQRGLQGQAAPEAGSPPVGSPRRGGCPDESAPDAGSADAGAPDAGLCARAR